MLCDDRKPLNQLEEREGKGMGVGSMEEEEGIIFP